MQDKVIDLVKLRFLWKHLSGVSRVHFVSLFRAGLLFKSCLQKIIVGHIRFTDVILLRYVWLVPLKLIWHLEFVTFIKHLLDKLLLCYEASVHVGCRLLVFFLDHVQYFLIVLKRKSESWFFYVTFAGILVCRTRTSSLLTLLLIKPLTVFVG